MSELSVRSAFPQLARHEGVWEGWYRYIDVNGEQIDAHRSRLVCRIPDETPSLYHQTNHYQWEDGSEEVRDFKGVIQGNRLVFDNDIIKGWAAQEPLDEHQRTMLLHWVRCGEPNIYLYEMIQLSDCGRFRTRVWQWIEDGQTVKRTLIDEQKVSDEWRGE